MSPTLAASSESDRYNALKLSASIMRLLESKSSHISIRLEDDNHQGESMSIPRPALQFLVSALEHMGQGDIVTVQALPAELTRCQAAGLLDVSLEFLDKLLETHEIPSSLDGGHRHIRFDDLMAYKQKKREARLAALKELTALGQEMNMGY